MTWNCPAIDHGITIFPFGKIGPCCQIGADALKPLHEISNPQRFADLKTHNPPEACRQCVNQEQQGLPSYRTFFQKRQKLGTGVQFLDLRTTNVCNFKCRYCGPHFSSQWAEELGIESGDPVDIVPYLDSVITTDLHWLYFTGGEPMLNAEHWHLLQRLVDQGMASQISLMYNTNLSTLKYKDVDIQNLWNNFQGITVSCSVDAVGRPLEYIRSGAVWTRIDANIRRLLTMPNVYVKLSPVISILNIWWLAELCDYAQSLKIDLDPIVLNGPDYLALDVVPDELKSTALQQVRASHGLNPNLVAQLESMINNNVNSNLFMHTVSHTVLLDALRDESLFDLVPFTSPAKKIILSNNDYSK